MRQIGICLVVTFLFIDAANAAQIANGTAARAQYCAAAHPADFYDAWIRNKCTKAPYGVKFEYLTSAWSCLCRGTD